jgi:hypothetical protein
MIREKVSICLYKNKELSDNREISLGSCCHHKNSTNQHMRKYFSILGFMLVCFC